MNGASEKGGGANGKTAGRGIFRRNVGGIDRLVRFGAGIALALVGLFQMSRGRGGGLAAILGIVVLVMAGIGICPLYIPFGISTARARRKSTTDPSRALHNAGTVGDKS
ncbi:MAG: DUF2892 domain-containing protein [Acidobacteriia bacterium]|nr:DUF2892 domain-containing protein [Terriglobia bacterium]